MHGDPQKKPLIASAFALGFEAVVVQTLLFREISLVLRSNDLVVGIVIACWLLFSGLGGLLGLFRRWHVVFAIFSLFGGCSSLLCHFLALQFSPATGEMWGFYRIIPFVVLTIAPSAFFAGSLFRALSREFSLFGKVERIYIFEGLGALAGGIVTLIIAGLFPPRMVLPIVVGFLAGAIFPLARNIRKGNIFAVVCFFSFALFPFFQIAEKKMYSMVRPGFELARFESAKGAIEVARREGEIYLFQGGGYYGSSGDSAVSDETVHPLLLFAKNPKKILISGGILQGAVSNALLYEPEKIVVLIGDANLLRIGKENFSLFGGLSDPRVETIVGDPIRSLKKVRERFDCVLIYSDIPQSSASGRFLSDMTFRRMREILSPDGFVAVIFPVSPNILTPEQSAVLSSVLGAMEMSFDSACAYLSGSSAILLAPDRGALGEMASSRALGEPPTERLSSGAISALFEHNRQSALRKSLAEWEIQPNTSDKPIAFLAGLILWERLAGGGFARSLAGIPLLTWIIMLFVFCSVIVLLDSFIFRGKIRIPVSAGLVGAIGISLSILNMYGFQLSVGMLYAGIGTITSLFMGGAVLGALLSSKRIIAQKEIWILLFLMLIPFTSAMSYLFGVPMSSLFGIIVFGLFNSYCGFVVGYFYPLALSVLREKSYSEGRSAGLVYGADLIGSSLCAPLFGIILIPALGVRGGILAIVFAIVLTALIFKRKT